MFLIQDIKDTQSYKIGYAVGEWIYHHPVLSIIVGIAISLGLVWLLSKFAKQIRTFGE